MIQPSADIVIRMFVGRTGREGVIQQQRLKSQHQ